MTTKKIKIFKNRFLQIKIIMMIKQFFKIRNYKMERNHKIYKNTNYPQIFSKIIQKKVCIFIKMMSKLMNRILLFFKIINYKTKEIKMNKIQKN